MYLMTLILHCYVKDCTAFSMRKYNIVGAIILDICIVINDRPPAEVDASRSVQTFDMFYDNILHLKRAIAKT